MADGPIIYPWTSFAPSPLERFVTGFTSGASTMLDLGKKADDLQAAMYEHEQAKRRQAAAEAATKGGQGGSSTTANMPAIDTSTGGGSGGTGGNPGSSTGQAGAGGISAQDLYSYLVNNRGATANEAALLTSAANNESSFRPNLIHDSGIGYGLFGHNGSRLQGPSGMYAYAGMDPNSPTGTQVPWQTQASFALDELRQRPEGQLVNKATTPEQLTTAQMHFEQPKGYAPDNPTALNRDGTHGGNWNQRLAATKEYMKTPPLLPQSQTAGTAGSGGSATTSATPEAAPAATPAAAPTQAIGIPQVPGYSAAGLGAGGAGWNLHPAGTGPAPSSMDAAPAPAGPQAALSSPGTALWGGPNQSLPDPRTLRGTATQPAPGPGAGVVGSGYDQSGVESQRDLARIQAQRANGTFYGQNSPGRQSYVPVPAVGGGYMPDYSQYAPGATQAMALAPPGQSVWSG